MTPKITPITLLIDEYNIAVAIANNPNFIDSLMIPGIGTGAFPEQLGSLGTVKENRIAATMSGKPIAHSILIPPFPFIQPQ